MSILVRMRSCSRSLISLRKLEIYCSFPFIDPSSRSYQVITTHSYLDHGVLNAGEGLQDLILTTNGLFWWEARRGGPYEEGVEFGRGGGLHGGDLKVLHLIFIINLITT